ncbi:type II toxin-antitoxin system HipA family toxin [Mesorhizobium sp.]|uniref:type II toxin-antitoxin system HipA family toxin n=1 Tax=Mesorhizobium sp. TaxID=1871066 RepID=UPI000FE62E86|nr:type II toxin-antitoxin system HipA family toxin [Mesorhizobium sp.]RWA94473.1 MAG: type II toxin-antitoxin system HipA family toxin [Mesorhizobium sp.]
MALHLVGETIDKARTYYLAQQGRLVQLMRGIYVDHSDDIDTMVHRHAIRIAHYLYPQAYLSAATAVLLAPTRDGRLFMSGRRSQRTRIRGLEIIQNIAPDHPAVAPAVVDDGMGEFRVNVSSIRQRFLEAFRLRSEHANSIDDATRTQIAERLVEEFGTPQAAADALWTLARENQWYHEGEQAERYLLRGPVAAPATNEAALDLVVAWHGEPMGHLAHDGFEWRWRAHEWHGPPLIRQTTPGRLPPFITALLPEGWLESVLKDRDERALLRSGKRYMSNITIVDDARELATLPADVLTTPLARFTTDGVFTGRYEGPGSGALKDSFERNLAAIFARSDTPRLSGIQIKAPMFLAHDGVLSPSTGQPFTHILKPGGTGGFEILPVVEYLSLTLGASAGFEAPSMALVPMPDGMPPALIVERFDIRRSGNDTRMLALEDFTSVLAVPTEAKYDGTIERVARALRPLSTSSEEDLIVVLKRAVFAWLIADGDMHLKNLALLKIAEPGSNRFASVRMAPLYDAVTTRVFPRLERDRIALKLNGKDDRLRRADFKALAATAGIKAGEADQAIDALVAAVGAAAGELSVPASFAADHAAVEVAAEIRRIVAERVESLS